MVWPKERDNKTKLTDEQNCVLPSRNSTVLLECCLAIEYIQYKMVSFPQKMYSLYSFKKFSWCLSVAFEAPLRTKNICTHLITSYDKKDHNGKTNDLLIKVNVLHNYNISQPTP